MNATAFTPAAPESYATFWEPATVPAATPTFTPVEAKDAYQEFVNVTEDEPTAPRPERAA
jgi:hypothetical protein